MSLEQMENGAANEIPEAKKEENPGTVVQQQI
jgi:hypothetical protein